MGWERELKVRFNDRVRFDEIERKLYSHDMSSMPEMVTSLFKTTPAAVVQPVNEQELLYLTAFARNYHLPLVPRGAGSSGYGGCVPSRGGIVVEMHRMNQIRSVNSDQMTATVEPGVIWSELEEKLNRQGLGVRTYPSSAPGATVGGWIAEGGGGIGGYAYGYLGSPGNIVALRVITPEGKIENMDETQALNLVYGAEGITGFITEATIKLRPYKGESVILARFPGVNNLVTALQEAEKQSLPLWNVSFSTARFLRLAGKAKGREEDTDSPSALFVFVKDDQETENKMYAIISACGGQISPPATAEEHWRERFFPMRIKQLGPSLIPSEAIVPLKRLDVFLNRQQQELPDLAVEGTLIRGEEGMETTLLGFLTGDERTFSYSLTYTKSLKMIDIAKATGGRVYALGLYFTDEAAQKLGHRLAELQSYKQAQDPESLFNPDKILPNNKKTLQFAMRAGKLFSPLAQGITKALPKQAGDNNKRIPPRLTRDAFACAQCGYCRNVCTLFKGKEWESASPRGKFYFLREYIKGNLPLTQEMTDKFLLCTTCKRCDDVCQVNIPIEERWQELRPILTEEKKMATFPGFEMMHSAFDHAHNIWAGRYSERAAWFPEDLEFQPEGEIGYWAGCTASYVEQDIARNAVRILAEGGEKFTYLAENEACCGIPFLMAGKPDVFASAVRNNITEANKRGIKKMIISCPGCWITWKRYYPEWAKKMDLPFDIQVEHITQTTERYLREGKINFKQDLPIKITWHDPCHIGRHGGIFTEPRTVLQALPGATFVEMEHHAENSLCCGSVLTRIGEPATSDILADQRLQEAVDVGADALVTTCPCCIFQLRVGGNIDLPILDFSDCVVKALGYDYQDSTEFTHKMWDVFDQALLQMTIPGMAEMMEELIPVMLEILPGIMKGMIGFMRQSPAPVKEGMGGAMNLMMPAMMPMLMGQLMPKMMPAAVELMERKIPDMPDSMRELMPLILPEVMNRMTPVILKQVMPLVQPELLRQMKEAEKKIG